MKRKKNNKENFFIEPPDEISEDYYESYKFKKQEFSGETVYYWRVKFEQKLTRIEDLPTWFLLEEYNICSTFDSVCWHAQLNFRLCGLVMLGVWGDGCLSYRDYLKQKIYKKNPAFCLQDEFKKIVNPWKIINEKRIKYLKNPNECREKALNRFQKNDIYDEPIQPISEGEVYDYSISGLDDNQNVCPHIKKDLFDYLNNFYLNTYSGKYSNHVDDSWIKINLAASDEILIEAFKNYLSNLRESSSKIIKKRISEIELKKWTRYNLLAALDLNIWSIAKRIIITDEIMALALNIDVDNYKHTIKPLLRSMFSITETLKIQCSFLRRINS